MGLRDSTRAPIERQAGDGRADIALLQLLSCVQRREISRQDVRVRFGNRPPQHPTVVSKRGGGGSISTCFVASLIGHVWTIRRDNVRLKNHSVLNVYFSRFGTVKLKQDVLFRWYEVLSEYHVPVLKKIYQSYRSYTRGNRVPGSSCSFGFFKTWSLTLGMFRRAE